MKFMYVAYLLSFDDSSGLLCGVLMWAGWLMDCLCTVNEQTGSLNW